MNPVDDASPAAPLRSPRPARWLVALVLAFGFLISVLHPIGDAPDERENLLYISLLAREHRKPVPGDHIRQNMHPPLSFMIHAAASVPLEALSRILPERVVWPFLLRVEVPLNQPSKVTLRDSGFLVQDGPSEFTAFTLLGMRLLSTLFVAFAAWFTCRTALLFLPGWPRLCAATAGFLLLTPGTVLQTGAIGMEAPLLFFGSWGAFELARGLRDNTTYVPWRAGLAFALAGLCRHAGFTLVLAAVAVAWARAPRVGRARAFWELCVAAAVAACGLGSWVLHNWITTGDPLVLYVNVAHFPEVFRTTAPTAASQDIWLTSIVSDYFGVRLPGVAPMLTFEFLFLLLLGAGLVAGVTAGLRRDDPLGGISPRARLAFGILTIVGVAIIPFSGNIHFYQTHGRYLLPAVPFASPFLAAGFRHVFGARRDAVSFAWIPALPAVATAIMLLFSLGPLFHPRTSAGRDSVFYADCGGPNDPCRTQGAPVPLGADHLFPNAKNTLVFDRDRIEYTIPYDGPPEGLWLHLTIPGITESSRAFSGVSYVYLASRVLVGDSILADWVSPCIEPTRWSYRIPPSAIADKTLVVRVDRVPRLDFVLLAEIEINRTPPSSLDQLGPKLRVAAADAREGTGEQLGASYARSYYIRHVPPGEKPGQIVTQTPRTTFAPGTYLFRVHAAALDGPAGAQAALMIAGDPTSPILKTLPITVPPNATRALQAYTIPFTVPDGPPVELTCRVETSGGAAFDLDDLEVFGPLPPDLPFNY